MQKIAQGWFLGSTNSEEQRKPKSSLLAYWNSYTAAQASKESSDSGWAFILNLDIGGGGDGNDNSNNNDREFTKRVASKACLRD